MATTRKQNDTSPSSQRLTASPVQLAVFVSEDFKDSFKLEDFINNVTRRFWDYSIEGNGQLNADKLLGSLSKSIDDLRVLARQVDRKIARVASDCTEADELHRRRLRQLDTSTDGIMEEFKKLDRRMNSVGDAAVRIGNSVELVDAQRRRAVLARRLIDYFLSFCATDGKPLDPLFTDPTRLHEACFILQKMHSFSQELHTPWFKPGAERVEQMMNTLENQLLDQFDRAAAADDFEAMKNCAMAAIEFNGGRTCFERYVNTRTMFFDPDKMGEDEMQGEGPRTASASEMEAALQRVYADIVASCKKEHGVIERVFPNPDRVMALVLTRIFEQRVRSYLESILSVVRGEGYLRMLAASYQHTLQLVQDLSYFHVASLDLRSLALSLFTDHRSAYLDNEVLFLSNLYAQEIKSHLEQKRTSKDAGRRGRKADDMASASANERGLVSPDLLASLIQHSRDAISRCCLLVDHSALPKSIYRIYKTLHEYVENYLNACLDNILERIVDGDGKADAYGELYRAVRGTTASVFLLLQHFHTLVSPHLTNFVTLHTQSLEERRELTATLEGKIVRGLDRAVQGTVAHIQQVLANEQRKHDYKSRDEDPLHPHLAPLDNNPTPACKRCVDIIHGHYRNISLNLDGDNMASFLTDLGHRLYALLIAHMKKYTYSSVGGLQLMRDLTEYQQAVKQFGVASVDEAFETLREVANVYLVSPDNLVPLIRESHGLSKMHHMEILVLCRLRSDYKQNKISKLIRSELFPKTAGAGEGPMIDDVEGDDLKGGGDGIS